MIALLVALAAQASPSPSPLPPPPSAVALRVALAEADLQLRECRADVAALERKLAPRTSTAGPSVLVYCPSAPEPAPALCTCPGREWWIDLLSHLGSGALGYGVAVAACRGAP